VTVCVVQSPVIVTVLIHTSNATMSRLDRIFRHYRVDVPGVRYLCVRAAGVRAPRGVASIETSCNDSRTLLSGLLCRNIESYAYFASHPELGRYLFRAMDDTILHVPNLLRLIGQLDVIYDARRELVFRGFLNDEDGTMMWLGGGSGWLISRPFVELHARRRFSFGANCRLSYMAQDDMTETIILQHASIPVQTWSDPLWAERCFNCRGTMWRAGDFSALEECPDAPTYRMNAIVSFHPAGKSEAEAAGLMIGEYPNNVRYFPQKGKGGIRVCRCTRSDAALYEPTVESLSAAAYHTTPEKLRM
jgi:hypothetical protein